jgi:hypothetical protein
MPEPTHAGIAGRRAPPLRATARRRRSQAHRRGNVGRDQRGRPSSPVSTRSASSEFEFEFELEFAGVLQIVTWASSAVAGVERGEFGHGSFVGRDAHPCHSAASRQRQRLTTRPEINVQEPRTVSAF